MGRSQETFGKKEKEKKRQKKREEKAKKREERKANSKKGSGFDNMISYVDEFGRITDTPPDPLKKKEEIDAESIVIGIPKKEDVYVDPVHKGRVEFFNHDKGYGFIKDDISQDKYFVHINGCEDDITESDKVQFELEQGLKGIVAVRVKKI